MWTPANPAAGGPPTGATSQQTVIRDHVVIRDAGAPSAQAPFVPVALGGQLWYLTARLPGLTLVAEDKSDKISQAPNSLLKLVRRFSSAVEQRFCKPKVGSSILSTGTIA